MRGLLFEGFEIDIDDTIWEMGLQWEYGIARHSGSVRFFYNRLMEIEKKNPVVLDIGACVGNYSMLAKFRPDAAFYAFEPNLRVFNLLVEQIRLNGLEDRVIPMHFGLYHKEGKKELAVHPRLTRGGSATFGEHPHKKHWDKIMVPVRKLDSFLHLWPNGVDLIKMDVEGAEWFVLRGGRTIFKIQKPPMLMEYVKANCKLFGYDRKILKETLRKWGYNHFQELNIDLWVTT